MKKRMLALGAALLFLVTLSACGGTAQTLPVLELETTAGEASGTEEVVRPHIDSADYEDTLAGLLSYLQASKAAAWDGEKVRLGEKVEIVDPANTAFVETSYKEIGAQEGYRCQFALNNKSTVQVEFYSFDPENLDEKAKACIASVKEKGFFQMLDKEVRAVLHPSEKYLMIYSDARAEGDQAVPLNAEQKAWAEQQFLKFHAE